MKVRGAKVCLSDAYSYPTGDNLLSGPSLFSETMAIDYAVQASCRALRHADISPRQIDLVVTMCISPDHVSDDANIMGPRLCHPLQRELGADSAMVFDLQDADWTFAFDVTQSFMTNLQYRYALVVRADCFTGVDTSSAGLLSWHSGAGAIVLERSNKAWQPLYKDLDDISSTARLELLDARYRFRGKKRAALYYPDNLGIRTDIDREGKKLIDELTRDTGTVTPINESWPLNTIESDEDHSHNLLQPRLGPYELAWHIDRNMDNDEYKSYACLTFDPFKHRIAACLLEAA